MKNINYKIYRVLLLYFAVCTQSYSQNLVVNNSFENQNECPSRVDDFSNAIGWNTPMKRDTPDYFSKCGRGKFNSLPKNEFGRQEAFEGKCYVGIVHTMTFGNERNTVRESPLREYIQGSFASELMAGKYYKIRIKVSTAERSTHFINSLNMSFSKRILKQKRSDLLKVKKLAILKPIESQDRDKWVSFEGVFQASGGENYFQVGNMIQSYETRVDNEIKEFPHFTTNFIYIYIDAIEVEELSTEKYLNSLRRDYTFSNQIIEPHLNLIFFRREKQKTISVDVSKLVRLGDRYYLLISAKDIPRKFRDPDSIAFTINESYHVFYKNDYSNYSKNKEKTFFLQNNYYVMSLN